MKMLAFVVSTLFLYISSFMSGGIVDSKEDSVKIIVGEQRNFYPTITGPLSVTSGTFVTWEGEDPNENECGNCNWRWDISKYSDFRNPGTDTWIGADGPDSDSGMHLFPIGGDIYGITSDDFYLRLVVIQSGNYYYSDTILITVN